MTVFWVALGGALGSVARYAFSGVAVRWLGAGFPYGTLFVNVTGSFTIGLLAALVASDGRPLLGADARACLLVGVLGGFTTFSSFSLETLNLARSGALGPAILNVAASVVLCLA
ncbi:MAG TPA: fluoride efflux transporter CrcB, partial [Gammaproteobacteria bacterium]|nr:fluoride efflux transporter CrcB [Gammaproteobacteria bacterium]